MRPKFDFIIRNIPTTRADAREGDKPFTCEVCGEQCAFPLQFRQKEYHPDALLGNGKIHPDFSAKQSFYTCINCYRNMNPRPDNEGWWEKK